LQPSEERHQLKKGKKAARKTRSGDILSGVKYLLFLELPQYLIPTLIAAMAESAILLTKGLTRPADRRGLTANKAALKLVGRTSIGIMVCTKFVAAPSLWRHQVCG
jgi:hypothetical protein